jgi:glycosyltransferase involved in cell wall biosynthesis
MSAPTLSVMMPNYNHARFIPDSLGAILAQSYRPAEIVIIDDGSTDDSVDVLERFAKKEPELIRLIRLERNVGLLPNMQRLLEMARGDYVYIPAFDDQILPGFLERSIGLLAQYPEAGLCSTLSGIMDESGQPHGLVQMPLVQRVPGYIPPRRALEALRRHGPWFMGNTTIFRRAALAKAGGYIPELGPYSDGFISLVVTLEHGACFIPERLALWRRMPTTYSRRVRMDLDATIGILDTAERLMRSRYRHLFPDDYVTEWKHDFVVGAASGFVAFSRDARFSGLERLVPLETAMDRAFLATLRAWPRLGRLVAKPYLFARFRRSHLSRAVIRKLEYRLRPRLRRLAG